MIFAIVAIHGNPCNEFCIFENPEVESQTTTGINIIKAAMRSSDEATQRNLRPI
jgi:hypothetical protein